MPRFIALLALTAVAIITSGTCQAGWFQKATGLTTPRPIRSFDVTTWRRVQNPSQLLPVDNPRPTQIPYVQPRQTYPAPQPYPSARPVRPIYTQPATAPAPPNFGYQGNRYQTYPSYQLAPTQPSGGAQLAGQILQIIGGALDD